MVCMLAERFKICPSYHVATRAPIRNWKYDLNLAWDIELKRARFRYYLPFIFIRYRNISVFVNEETKIVYAPF